MLGWKLQSTKGIGQKLLRYCSQPRLPRGRDKTPPGSVALRLPTLRPARFICIQPTHVCVPHACMPWHLQFASICTHCAWLVLASVPRCHGAGARWSESSSRFCGTHPGHCPRPDALVVPPFGCALHPVHLCARVWLPPWVSRQSCIM